MTTKPPHSQRKECFTCILPHQPIAIHGMSLNLCGWKALVTEWAGYLCTRWEDRSRYFLLSIFLVINLKNLKNMTNSNCISFTKYLCPKRTARGSILYFTYFQWHQSFCQILDSRLGDTLTQLILIQCLPTVC